MPFAAHIKRETGLTTIAVGLITQPRQAEEIIASGQADLTALGRGMLYNPRWPWHAAAELGACVDAPPQYLRCEPHGVRTSSGRADHPGSAAWKGRQRPCGSMLFLPGSCECHAREEGSQILVSLLKNSRP